MTSAVLLKFIVAMLVMMNPLSALSIFLNLTQSYTFLEKRQTARQCAISILIIMIFIIWSGDSLLSLLGISMASFRFAGGIILLLIGLSMLQSHPSAVNYTPEENAAAQKQESIAIVPLGLPMIIGPGAISTIIVFCNDHSTYIDKGITSLVAVGLALSVMLVLYYADYINRLVGITVIKVITRIMGMMITAIASGMLAQGAIGLIPALGRI